MPWNRNRYYYTEYVLAKIAEAYPSIYENGIDFGFGNLVTHETAVVEFKADFDLAVKSLSPRKQRFIEMLVGGADSFDMEQGGYYNPALFVRMVFNEMVRFLNKGEL